MSRNRDLAQTLAHTGVYDPTNLSMGQHRGEAFITWLYVLRIFFLNL